MKTLVMVDVQSLFYGMKRVTGDYFARVDYQKLRDLLKEGSDVLQLNAYIMTLVTDQNRRGQKSDENFAKMLRKFGYNVKRHYCTMEITDGATRNVTVSKPTQMTREIVLDAIRFLPTVDRVIIVSGSGAMLPVARKAKELGKQVWVACFEKAGDLNRELRKAVDNVITLDAEMQWKPNVG